MTQIKEEPASSCELRIKDESEIVSARHQIREICRDAGFSLTDVTRIITATSELLRNIQRYAGEGLVKWVLVKNETGQQGIQLEFIDQGPGIEDIDQAMAEGFSTSKSLGIGLPGTKRLVDEMEIESEAGKGTRILIRKWKRF